MGRLFSVCHFVASIQFFVSVGLVSFIT
jgi:hypothetical protein